MEPASKRARAGSMGQCMSHGRAASATSSTPDGDECPICFNVFETSGPRTKVRPFRCEGGQLHPICRACDCTMFKRHDDRCPTCRAARDVPTSDARYRGRSPPPMREAPVLLPGGWGGVGAAQLMFFPIEPSMDAPAHRADLGSGLVHGFALAAQNRRSRAAQPIPVVISVDSDGDGDDVATAPDTSGDAILAAILGGDNGQISAALEGLTNVADVPLAQFVRHMAPGAHARPPQRGRSLSDGNGRRGTASVGGGHGVAEQVQVAVRRYTR